MKLNIINSLLIAAGLSAATVLTACDEKYDSYSLNNTYEAPVIASVSPLEGLPSATITITGQNFGSEQNSQDRVGRVYFGGVEASEVVAWSDSEIKVKVPQGAVSGAVTVWVWKNSAQAAEEFTCIPGAELTAVTSPAYPGSEITITGKNFDYFLEKGLKAEDVAVIFNSEDGTVSAPATEFTQTEVKVTVPFAAKAGKVKVQFGELQTVEGPELLLVGDLYIDMFNYYAILDKNGKDNMVSEDDGSLGNTKNGSYIVYEFEAPATGLFDVKMLVGTTKDGSYLNVNIGNTPSIETAPVDDALTQAFPNTGSWTCDYQMSWGAFYLKSGETYYLKVTFIQESTSWVGNAKDIFLTLSADQTQTPVNGTGNMDVDYVLYENKFEGSNFFPFRYGWAWDPSYIKMIDGYCEYYFNQEACTNDNRRERRGCELVCDFSTDSEAWYGYKLYLPTGGMPKDLSGTIITQFFNQGRRNSWAGHLTIDKENLVVSYRHALVDPVVKTVGKLQWDAWQDVVVYYRVGKNNQGCIKVWLGDNLDENNPTLTCEGINFGFAENWIDDTHFDTTPYEYEGSTYTDKMGGKWGFYVQDGGDRTMRMDNLRILEGNPAGAFSIVNPSK